MAGEWGTYWKWVLKARTVAFLTLTSLIITQKSYASIFSALCVTSGSLPNPNRQVIGDTILFHSVQIGSSAVYQCNASNEHGYLLANAFVNILGKKRYHSFKKSSERSQDCDYINLVFFLDMAPRILGPKNQLIKVTENNRTFLDCPFFGSPFPLLRWWAYVPLFEKIN